ncbi:hypothetical protein [Anaerococcus obesiensis]|uniref:hypothetical protein n=1 Tax=Anaerococcus obesiensis TaxID=1287640 RepID=UPI001F3C3B7B|nr:hypothetical protein [Anaerococcus obesiensis]
MDSNKYIGSRWCSPKNSYTIDADYEWYWNQGPGPLTANYYTDIYEENGEKYFKGVSYYNAVDEKNRKRQGL